MADKLTVERTGTYGEPGNLRRAAAGRPIDEQANRHDRPAARLGRAAPSSRLCLSQQLPCIISASQNRKDALTLRAAETVSVIHVKSSEQNVSRDSCRHAPLTQGFEKTLKFGHRLHDTRTALNFRERMAEGGGLEPPQPLSG